MNQSTKRILFFILTLSFLLAACAPTAAPAATQDPAELQAQIEQAVAATVAAQNTQSAEAEALIVPSNTPLPTQTEAVTLPSPTPIIPTATPFVIVPPVVAPVTGGGGVPAPKPEYACDIINQKPFDNEAFKPNADFDIKWTIVNTGTRTWAAGLDLKYFSGPNMTTTKFVELPQMKPGDKFSVVMDAKAPSKVGFHVMTFVLEGPICYPYVAINVEK